MTDARKNSESNIHCLLRNIQLNRSTAKAAAKIVGAMNILRG
jgi:hypothetical protein